MGNVLECLRMTLPIVGLFFGAWWLLGRLLCPLPAPGSRVVILGRGAGEEIESSVRAFQCLRSMGLLECPILIVDIDLTPEGRDAVQRLVCRWPEVELYPSDRLESYLARVECGIKEA